MICEYEPSIQSSSESKSDSQLLLWDFSNNEIIIGRKVTVLDPHLNLPGTIYFNSSRCSLISQENNTAIPCYLVQVYQNLKKVVQFIDTYFPETELDLPNQPFQYTVTINCQINDSKSTIIKACWSPNDKQTIFGNCDRINTTVAILLDVVAHEFCHGLIYRLFRQFGRYGLGRDMAEEALEESLCDLFAVLVCNSGRAKSEWDWRIGHIQRNQFIQEDFILRDLTQIIHLNQYQTLTDRYERARIHSYAFYRLMSLIDDDADYLELAVGLFQNIFGYFIDRKKQQETLGFQDSYYGMLNAIPTITSNEERRDQIRQALQIAFREVEIID
jgi:Zn-dependent metalloprotease